MSKDGNKVKKRLLKCCIISANKKILNEPTGLNHFLSKKKGKEKKHTNRPLHSANMRRVKKLLKM